MAALNFGLVIATTLRSFGINNENDLIKHTVYAGLFAGSILAMVYMMLSYMGMCSSNVYAIQDNGAWTLRNIVYQLYGPDGAYLLAAIFSLACLTTCVGLINSISQYFSVLFKMDKLPQMGIYYSFVFIFNLQFGVKRHSRHFNSHT